jgi:hypothetical protein
MRALGGVSIRVLGRLAFARLPYLVVALGMLANAAVALCIGVLDVFSPVTLSAQLIGLSYLIAGLISVSGLVGVFLLFRKTQSFTWLAEIKNADYRRVLARVRGEFTRPLEIIVGAAVAGLYIDWTIFYYSFHYIIPYVIIFGVLGMLYTCLAGVTLPAIWKDVSRGLKAFGISLAALGAVTQFLYQSVYVPENTPTGMEYSFSVGSQVQSGYGKIIQVHVTMEDEGSVPNAVLGSMVAVSTFKYIEESQPTKHSKKPQTTVPIQQFMPIDTFCPIDNGGFLYPNETYSFDRTELIPPADAAIGIQFTLSLYFVRATWLTLGLPNGTGLPPQTSDNPCSRTQNTQSEWDTRESHLTHFTQGYQVVYLNWCVVHSDWCPARRGSTAYPYITAGIYGVRDGKLVPTQSQSNIGSDLGIIVSSRIYMLLLS